MKNLLFEVSPIDPLTTEPVTLRMAGAQVGSAGLFLGDEVWLPAITEGPVRSIQLSQSGQHEIISISHGNISFLLSADLDNLAWSKLEWNGAQATILIGEEGDAFEDYAPLYTGTVGPIERDGLVGTVALLGAEAILDEDLLSASYGGTGDADGHENIKGNLKPWCSGACSNIEPVLIDPVNWIYQYHLSATDGVQAVYENANDLGDAADTFSDYTALKTASLAQGTWADAPALGMFRLASEPSGTITADVHGAKDGSTYVSTLGGIVSHILKTAGIDASDIDASVTDLDVDWCLYTADQATYGEIVREALYEAGGYIFADEAGKWVAGNYFETGDPTALELPYDAGGGPLVVKVRQLASTPPVYRVKIGADRNWRPMSDNEFFVLDAQAGIVAMLTQPVAFVPATSDGTLTGSLSGAGGNYRVTDGTDDVSTGHGITYSVVSETGVDVSIDGSSGVYTVNSMSADFGIAVFRAVYGGTNFDSTYTITKVKAGPTGETGADGTPPALPPQPSISNQAATVAAFSDGNVINYAGASGEWKIYQTNGDGSISDVTGDFTYSVIGNPDGLFGPFGGTGDATLMSGANYAIYGGMPANVDNTSITMQADGTGVYTGVTFTAVFNITKTTNLGADTLSPAAPSSLSVSSSVGVETDGSNFITLVATWTAPTTNSDGSSLTDLYGYEIALTTSADTGYTSADIRTSPTNRFVSVVRANTAMRGKVRAVDTSGNRSSWSSEYTFTTAADSNAPSAPTSFTVGFYPSGGFFLNWVNPSDADLDCVVVYENTTNNSGTATAVAKVDAVPSANGWTSRAYATGTTRYFWLKAQDTSGNQSAFTSVASGTVIQITGPDIAANSIVTNHIAVGTLNGDRIQANTLNANTITAGTTISDTVIIGTSGQTFANTANPAGIINGGSTLITPGKIQISGATTLANWSASGDTTKIDGGKIYTNSITTGSIAAGTITTTEIANGTITGTDIAGTTITGSNIATGAITAAKIAAGTITATEIASSAVTTTKLAANSVTSAKIDVSQLDAISATIGTLRTATTGARMEIIGTSTTNQILVYDASNTLRVRLGIW